MSYSNEKIHLMLCNIFFLIILEYLRLKNIYFCGTPYIRKNHNRLVHLVCSDRSVIICFLFDKKPASQPHRFEADLSRFSLLCVSDDGEERQRWWVDEGANATPELRNELWPSGARTLAVVGHKLLWQGYSKCWLNR